MTTTHPAPVGSVRPAVGDALPTLSVRFDRESLVRYAGASGDFNPIHFSGHAAHAVGLPDVIAHGMLTMGTALRLVTQWAGAGATVRAYGVRFARPVVVPDDGVGAEVEFSGRVTAVDGSVVSVSVEGVCDGEKVLSGGRVEIDLGG